MVFYIALGVACCIVAAVALWLFRSVVEVGKTAYRAILPSARGQKQSTRLAHLNNTLSETPNPWGWAGADGARRAALHKDKTTTRRNRKSQKRSGGSSEKTPWGWPGSDGLHQSNREMIADGMENSAAVAAVRNLVSGDDKSSEKVGWPYRDEGNKTKRGKQQTRERYVGFGATPDKRSKPWGW